jgi:pullulanase/glycogen debranching enzyme
LLNEGAMDGRKTGKRLFAVFNAAATPVSFKLPELANGQGWQRVLDTSEPSLDPKQPSAVGKAYQIPARSVVVFTQDPKLSA